MTTTPDPRVAALEALMPPDDFIDSTGDYEMLEVCFRFEGYRWREFRAALATPTVESAEPTGLPAPEAAVERCAVCGQPEQGTAAHNFGMFNTDPACHPFQPAPTPPAPTEAAEALRDALLASAVYVANELDWKCVPLDGLRERLDAIIAAARAPLTVDRDRLRELATEARLVSQWYDAVDLMPTELRAELDDLGQHAAAILAALEEQR